MTGMCMNCRTQRLVRGREASESRGLVDPQLFRVRGPHAAFDSPLFISYSEFDPTFRYPPRPLHPSLLLLGHLHHPL